MFGIPGGYEWIVILVIALLLFGRRLPDVARSIGKSIVEFKKGLNDVKNEIDVSPTIRETRKQIQDAGRQERPQDGGLDDGEDDDASNSAADTAAQESRG